MPILKRKSPPDPDALVEPVKLQITAGVKRPIPKDGRIRHMVGENPPASTVRAIGAIAASISDPTDDLLTIEDRVTALRSSYDLKNPQEARYRNRVRNRGTAITALCITCQGGRKAVTECIATVCPLWAFRFGTDPFYGRRK